MATRLRVQGDPTRSDIVSLYRDLFDRDGEYHVEYVRPLAKASAAAEEFFDEWFMQLIERAARERFVTSQLAIWDAIEGIMRSRGADGSDTDWWELNRTIFDLTRASTARMVGFTVPADVTKRLTGVGFAPPEALDFPAIAYRVGLINSYLLSRPQPMKWADLVKIASRMPLSGAEQAGVEYARIRAGSYLAPLLEQSAQSLVNEQLRVQGITARALEQRSGTRAAGRELGNANRAEGILRDSDRVIRTEMSNARGNGVWQAEISKLPADAQLYRVPSRDACRGCLRLWLAASGMPRLYTKAEFEAGEALGFNGGNWREWHPVRGAVHPNCACSPCQEWRAELQSTFERAAEARREMLEDLKVFEEAA